MASVSRYSGISSQPLPFPFSWRARPAAPRSAMSNTWIPLHWPELEPDSRPEPSSGGHNRAPNYSEYGNKTFRINQKLSPDSQTTFLDPTNDCNQKVSPPIKYARTPKSYLVQKAFSIQMVIWHSKVPFWARKWFIADHFGPFGYFCLRRCFRTRRFSNKDVFQSNRAGLAKKAF